METLLVPGRSKSFIFQLFDDDNLPVDNWPVNVRILRVSGEQILYEWNGTDWVSYDQTSEYWNAMTGLDTNGLYVYSLPGSAIGIWYQQEIIVQYLADNFPVAGYSVRESEAYKVVEKVVEEQTTVIDAGYRFIDQDGWWDDDGVLHEWGDELAGYIYNDDTGARLVSVSITIHETINGEVIRTSNPVKQMFSNWQGNWSGWIMPGTYRFYFFKDYFIDKYVDRTVG